MSRLRVEWVTGQMNPSGFLTGENTSLRKYWRKRLNARKTETYRIGEAGPHACEKNSRWRRFAFTKLDLQHAKVRGDTAPELYCDLILIPYSNTLLLLQELWWGNMELGNKFQFESGHVVTVEKVVSFELDYVPSTDLSARTCKDVSFAGYDSFLVREDRSFFVQVLPFEAGPSPDRAGNQFGLFCFWGSGLGLDTFTPP